MSGVCLLGFSFRTTPCVKAISFFALDTKRYSNTLLWYSFLRVSLAKFHKQGDFKQEGCSILSWFHRQEVFRNMLLPKPLGWILLCLAQLLGAPGVPWLLVAAVQSLPLCSPGQLASVSEASYSDLWVYLCPNLPLLIRTPVILN